MFKSTYRESVRPTPAAASRVLAGQDAGRIDLDDPTHSGSRVALRPTAQCAAVSAVAAESSFIGDGDH